jgi:lysylphosphatidylglycerol synthetase-like protein (DUF2156 family)
METVISSRSTFITKWLFPIAWFGFLIFFIAESLQHDTSNENLLFIVVPVLMAVFGFFFFKALVWDLADTVVDHGTHLVVSRRGVEETIPMANIMNVSSTPLMNPPRVTLRLVKAGAFGTHVSFSPKSSPFSFGLSAKNKVAEQLMERAYAARAQRAG